MNDFLETLAGEVSGDTYDRNNHMNVIHYLKYFDIATNNLFLKIGFDDNYIRENSIGLVASRILTSHKKEMFIGDKFIIKSALISIERDMLIVTNRMYRNNVLVSVSDMAMCVVNLVSRERMKIPDEFFSKSQKLIIPGLKNPFSEFK